jgi:spore germination protein YaaH
MKNLRLVLTWLLLVFALPVSGFSQKKLEVLFAYRPRSFDALKKHIDQVTIVAPAPFIVDKSGVVYGEIEPKLLKLTKEHNVKVMPQIKNLDRSKGLFSEEWVHSILNNKKTRERTIRSMVDLCKQYSLWGMQIDFENVHVDDKDALTQFYREAAAALHQEGFKISIAVVHRAEESAGPNTYTKWMMENWRGAYDLKALGEIGDFIKIMSYAQHTRRTTPGPSQGLPWLEQVVQYFLKFVPPEKLSLGITMGAFHYFTVAEPSKYYQNARSWSRSISAQEVKSLLEQYNGHPLIWDDKQKVSFSYIERGGVFEWFFIDNDIRSFEAKLDLVKKYKLRGINSWISGQEDPRIWERIQEFSWD